MSAPLPPTLLLCPVCRAVVTFGAVDEHVTWHRATATLDGWTEAGALYAVSQAATEAPTQKFPPIGQTVLRRPPPPDVRELRGPELLRALADEMDRDGLSGDDL